MTLIDLGDFKLRFDNKEIRISIDGDLIDVGARRTEEEEPLPQTNEDSARVFPLIGGDYLVNGKRMSIDEIMKLSNQK